MQGGQERSADRSTMPPGQGIARRRLLRWLLLAALTGAQGRAALPLLGRLMSLVWLFGRPGEARAVDSAGAGAADSAAAAAPGHGSLLPAADDWNAACFALHTEAAVAAAVGLTGTPRTGPEVELRAPEIAENGAVVPLEVRSTLAEVRRIVIVVPANPNALVADFRFGKRATPLLGTRIKLAGTCEVIALVETGAGWWRAQKQVKVTLGGCGG